MNWVTISDIAAKKKNAIVDGPFGSNMKTSDYVVKGVPVLQGKNITKNKFQWFDVRYISEEKAQELIRSKVEVGDILMVKIGSIGYVAEIDNLNGFPFAIIPANLAKITLDQAKINSTYFRYYFQNEKVKGKLLSLASKTAQPALSLTKIKEFKIPLPDLKTQQEIAHVLEQADKARQQRKAANALTDQFLQSSFLSLFGDPVKNEKGWDVKKLDTLCTKITDGEHTTPIRENSGIKLLSARNVKNGYIDLDAGLDYIGQAEYDRINKRCNPEFDDVLLSCSGTVGRVSTVNISEPFSLVRSVALIKPKKNLIISKYLEFFLRSDYGQYQIDVRANKSSQANIFTGPIKELDIVVPPLSLQQQFAGIVAQAKALRKKQKENEIELENLFQSLLQKYFG